MKDRIAHPQSIFLLCLALIVLGVVVALAACTAPTAPTPTPTRTPMPTVTPRPAIPEAKDDWARIKAAGVIQVASPLDNAPFNMYDEDRKPDGFDVALMNNLARRLGLRVEFVDVPFEGLLSALRLGQADAAIAAMAVTPDRQAQVDFTQTYYVGEDGILAAPDSDISAVTTRADVINRQVGVVRGTVYEWWLTENLIKTGEMPAANLHVYLRPDDAISELDKGYIDLVVLDREAAQTYAAQGRAKLVGKSQYTQNFAIPVRQGSPLLPQLNKALAAALADGTVGGLIEQYLNIPEDQQLPVPTPTPQPAVVPTATPTPAGAAPPVSCDNGTGFDAKTVDQTVPDGTKMQPGEAFEKRWRIANVGTCDWTASYSFVYANKGERMGGQDAPIGKAVPKGSSLEVSVVMTAPSAPGKHYGYWQVADAKGQPFGKQVYVEIMVVAPSPTPTQTPPANISWKVDRDHIKQGESAYFTLNVTGVKNVWFNEKGQPYVGVNGLSTQKVTPPRDTTYQLRVEQNDGNFWNDYRTIYVAQAVGAPAIAQFGINPQYEVVMGQPVTLSWVVQGVADGVALLRDGVQLHQTTAVTSSYTDKPPAGNPVTYELQAWGPGGSANPAYQQITVKKEVPPQPPPAITRFDSNPPGEVVAGNCLDLSWDVQGAVEGLELKVNGSPLPVDSPGGRSFHDCECPRNAGTCTYELRAWGPGGSANPAALQINVKPEAPPAPVITQFDYSPPGPVLQGDCVNLSWDLQGAVQGLELKVNGNPLPVDPGSRSLQDCQCPQNIGTCAYELRAWNQSGGDDRGLSVEVIMKTLPGNPAATFCEDNGGRYDGEQNTCTLSDGTVCDAWAYVNGECPAPQ
jgi:polar amino acid transport system substrate-binding protein